MLNLIKYIYYCGKCKHKGEPIENAGKPTTYFLCHLIEHLNTYRPEEYRPGLGAGAVDGSGYHAALCVENDFGCNRWEPK